MNKHTIVVLLCLTCLGGCASPPPAGSKARPGVDIVMTDANPISLRTFAAGREFAAAGRYELAREQYLLAYAAAGDDPVLRGMLQQELKSIELMIHTLR